MYNGTMRLFLGFSLNKDWTQAFENYRDQFDGVPYLKFSPLANLHVTACFLGEVDERLLPDVVRIIGKIALHHNSFLFRFERTGYAPQGRSASMVWAYMELAACFVALVEELRRELLPFAPQMDFDHAIKPHITLARFRRGISPPRELAELGHVGREGDEFRATELILYESHLSGNNPLYRITASFPLVSRNELA